MSAYVAHMEPDLEAAAALFKALSHPSRLLICCQLLDGPMTVAALETTLNLKQPNLSRELAKLRAEGLVQAARNSGAVTYCLADVRIGWLLNAYRHQGAVPQGLPARPAPTPPPKRTPPNQSGGGMFARTFPPKSLQTEEI